MTQFAPTRTESTDNAATPGNKPADKFREGPVHVSIWENQGVNGTFRVASFELRYKKDEQWQTSQSYGASDLKFLENAAKRPAIALRAGCVRLAPDMAMGLQHKQELVRKVALKAICPNPRIGRAPRSQELATRSSK